MALMPLQDIYQQVPFFNRMRMTFLDNYSHWPTKTFNLTLLHMRILHFQKKQPILYYLKKKMKLNIKRCIFVGGELKWQPQEMQIANYTSRVHWMDQVQQIKCNFLQITWQNYLKISWWDFGDRRRRLLTERWLKVNHYFSDKDSSNDIMITLWNRKKWCECHWTFLQRTAVFFS